MISALNFLIVLILLKSIAAKPVNDTIVFLDEDDKDNENQIITSIDADGEIFESDFENGELFQGDIILLREQEEFLLTNTTSESVSTRTGLLDQDYRWSKNYHGHVIIPYTTSDYSEFSLVWKEIASELRKKTCLFFQLMKS